MRHESDAELPQSSAVWPDCGYHTLTRTSDDYLGVSDDFLRQVFLRPELAPIDSSCAAERALHRSLLDAPRRPVTERDLRNLADPDAQENYRFALSFRHLLLSQGTIEAAYLTWAGGRADPSLPPTLMSLLVQIQCQHLLRDSNDPFLWRVAEIFFRPQKVSLEAGLLLADAEVLEHRQQATGSVTVLQRLIRQAQGESAGIREHLGVLTPDSANHYWTQREHFSLAVSLHESTPGQTALCRLLEVWLKHFHAVETHIEFVPHIEAQEWHWHIGLDAQCNRILNALYQGETVHDDTLRQLLALFKLEFADPSVVRPELQGCPVHLGLAMDEDQQLRLKPQNLLLNLPLAECN